MSILKIEFMLLLNKYAPSDRSQINPIKLLYNTTFSV